MNFLYLATILLLFSLSKPLFATATNAQFNNEQELKSLWSSWGEVVSQFDPTVGNKGLGSVLLHSESGQQVVLYRKFEGLKKRGVSVKFSLRASRLSSLELFYLNSKGEHQFLEHALEGSFDWTDVEFTAPTYSGKFELWIRLNGPGKIWVDDFSLHEESSVTRELSAKPTYTQPFDPFLLPQKPTCNMTSKGSRVLAFKQGQAGLLSKIQSQKYYHLNVEKIKSLNLSHHDLLELEVINPSNKGLTFYFVLKDVNSSNYWQQLNHSVTLHPGKNLVRVPLKQYVGERGSHRERRLIDLANLKSAYFVVDPDKKENLVKEISLSALSIFSSPRVATFDGLIAFDFTNSVDNVMPCFIGVTPYHRISQGDFFGLRIKDPVKVSDSVYSDTLNRYSIDVERASFMVKVPNGKYRILLNINKLGYWNTPFWKRRFIEINGKPLKLETRSGVQDYLKDYLRFELTSPTVDDHPWDLYLSKIFSPLDFEVEVTNGLISIDLEGDTSALSLNSLIISRSSNKQKLDKFLSDLSEVQKSQFDEIMNLIPQGDPERTSQSPILRILPALTRISPKTDPTTLPVAKNFHDSLFNNDQSLFNFVLKLPIESRVKFKVSGLSSISTQLYLGQFRYMSLDRNHQTYSLMSRQLMPIDTLDGVTLEPDINHHLFLRLKSGSNLIAGNQSGFLDIIVNETSKFKIPINLKVYNHDLPQIDFPVGFLGLQSTPLSFFQGSIQEARTFRIKMAELALDELHQRGFTTFSGLPSIGLDFNSPDTSELDSLIKAVRRRGFKKIFSYSGLFPHEVLNSWDNLNQELYKPLLNKFLSSKNPEVIVNFSDEALGYSGTLDRDIKRGEFLKKNFAGWNLGGFSQPTNIPKGKALNSLFHEGSYSSYDNEYMSSLEREGKKWGLYNQASEPTHNPRFSMGVGLYVARYLGLSHLLEWHLSAFHNYPYYDLDGRENDSAMLYPTSSGRLLSSIKFEQASQGIRDYRKLKWLELQSRLAPIDKTELRKLRSELPKDFLARGFEVNAKFTDLIELLDELSSL